MSDIFGLDNLDDGFSLDPFSSSDLKMPSNPFGATNESAEAGTGVSAVGAAASAAGSIFGAVANVMNGMSKAKADRQQAAQDRYNSAQEYIQGKVATNIQRQKANAVIGRMTSEYSASGVDVNAGSAASEIHQSSLAAFEDAANIQKSFASKARSLDLEATQKEIQARNDEANGFLGAAGDVSKGLASLLKL